MPRCYLWPDGRLRISATTVVELPSSKGTKEQSQRFPHAQVGHGAPFEVPRVDRPGQLRPAVRGAAVDPGPLEEGDQLAMLVAALGLNEDAPPFDRRVDGLAAVRLVAVHCGPDSGRLLDLAHAERQCGVIVLDDDSAHDLPPEPSTKTVWGKCPGATSLRRRPHTRRNMRGCGKSRPDRRLAIRAGRAGQRCRTDGGSAPPKSALACANGPFGEAAPGIFPCRKARCPRGTGRRPSRASEPVHYLSRPSYASPSLMTA